MLLKSHWNNIAIFCLNLDNVVVSFTRFLFGLVAPVYSLGSDNGWTGCLFFAEANNESFFKKKDFLNYTKLNFKVYISTTNIIQILHNSMNFSIAQERPIKTVALKRYF